MKPDLTLSSSILYLSRPFLEVYSDDLLASSTSQVPAQ